MIRALDSSRADRLMRARFITRFLGVAALGTMCGCSSLELVFKPSDGAKHASFTRARALFTADLDAISHQTYIVVSGDWESETPYIDATTGKIVLPPIKNKKSWSQGLAVGLESDGYLLTAGHVVGARNFVWGTFDGRVDVRPAKVVFQRHSKTHADLALIKVAAKLDHYASFGDEPKVGDRSFAVVSYRGGTQVDVILDFAAGTVRRVRKGPSGTPGDLIDTDVPLWYGDSGGPLFSSTGQLISIATGYEIEWYGVYWKYRRISFLPEKRFIQDLIARDRILHQ